MDNIQSIAALGIVGITLAIFAYRLLRKSSGKCGGGCCSVKPKTDQSEIFKAQQK